MPDAAPVVIDASALLAYLRDEPGAEAVADAIAEGAVMSAVNLGEVLSRAADRGADPGALAGELAARGLLHGAIDVEPFLPADAIDVAVLRPLTRAAGLSIADRACLALARRLGTQALTADTAWRDLEGHVDVALIQIR